MIPVNQEVIAAMKAITISREYGSGGGEIAMRLAQRLGWHLIDHEIVVRMAQELGMSQDEAEEYDEYAEDNLTHLLNSFRLVQTALPAPISLAVQLTLNSRAYHEARQRVIKGVIASGQAVIVGHGAQVLLAQRRDVLHARIVAPLELRIAYVMRREGLDRTATQQRIQMKDHDRVRFLQAVHNRHPADAYMYDLVVNTGVLDLDSVVDLLVVALERKAQRLSVPASELGPGACLGPYTGQPADFPAPASDTRPQG